MKRKILKLSEAVINQIAAGEVVENPASIVKELIENSLDAGAKRILVEIKSGGLEKIVVEDDGVGMDLENALLSLERHATSKIESVHDLETLKSMGFRGEALAAIASISLLEMKTSDGKKGTEILSSFGEVQSILPCARNQGTTFSISSLFENVPARKKFQKSAKSCFLQVKKVVEVASLANPEVAFFFNEEEYFPSDLKGRIEKVLGEHEHAIETKYVKGYVASPSKISLNRSGQYFFINKRPVQSFLVSKAVKQAFSTRIGENEHPRFVLFLTIDPHEVDINVHPQKKEVRFKNESKIFQIVLDAVSSAFTLKGELFPSFHFPEREKETFSDAFFMPPFKTYEREVELEFGYQERALGVFGKFLLLEKQRLILVDLAACSARLIYESMKEKKREAEPLLSPIQVDLLDGDEEKIEGLERLGFEVRVLKKQLVVDAVPQFFEPSSFFEFFLHFKEGKELEVSASFTGRAKKHYGLSEALSLWEGVKRCKDPIYAPMGNLISRELTEEDLERFISGKNSTSKV